MVVSTTTTIESFQKFVVKHWSSDLLPYTKEKVKICTEFCEGHAFNELDDGQCSEEMKPVIRIDLSELDSRDPQEWGQ